MTLATSPGPDPALAAAKQALRQDAAARRANLARDNDGTAAQSLCDRLRAALDAAGGIAGDAVVSGYWPLGDEMDPRPAMRSLHEAGRRVALPVVSGRDRPLLFREWTPASALTEGAFRVMEPGPGAAELEPRVLLVPLLAFDRAGRRLGWGAGFYDRTIAALRDRGPCLAIGIAWAGQRVAAVPADDFDESLDLIVTEAGAIPPEDRP